MFKLLKNKRAQNTAEYAILIAVVIGAAIAMQTYVKRGIQGKVKEKVDELGSTQYEPYYLSTEFKNTDKATDKENVSLGGSVARTTDRTTQRKGTQTYSGAQSE